MSNSRFGFRTREGEINDIILNNSTSNLLLDNFPNSRVAYSLRKLRSAYSGSAIRVRRSNDNAEQDIGFSLEGYLDTTALLSFVGVNDGFVTTWYDQSGNGFNAVQTTSSRQPLIVSSGILNVLNGQPTLIFNGTSHCFQAASVALQTFVMPFVVARSTTGGKQYFEHSANSNNNDGMFFAGTFVAAWNFRRSTTHFGQSGNADWTGLGQVLASMTYDGVGTVYRNSVFITNSTGGGTARPNTTVTTALNIGSRNQSSTFYNGEMQEFVIYNTDLGTRLGIETNINRYYNIF
jgi:hypothetical protein